jgi:hypothetical protein
MKGTTVITTTQTSSKARVKHDGIGEDMIKNIFDNYTVMHVEDFRNLCIQAIEASTGKKETKQKFINIIQAVQSKTTMMTKVTNYFLAGEGKKV